MNNGRIITTLAGILPFLWIAGCGGDYRSNHHDLGWLTGTWADTSAGYYEEWSRKGKGYEGKGFSVADNDTLFEEYLVITGTDSWTYYATVEGQNDGRSIPFRLVNNDPDSLVFENRNHDFPNNIIYSRRSLDHIRVIVSSTDGDRSFHLDLKKVRP